MSSPWAKVTAIGRGLWVPVVIGVAAWVIGLYVPVVGAPIIAIVLGLVVGNIAGQPASWAKGRAFASKKVLQTSIVLMGAGMSLQQVASVGWQGFPVMVGTIATAIAGGIVIGRAMKVEREARILVTYGTAICGASAIATMSVVIAASAEAVATSVAVIVVYNVLGAILFPTLGHAMGMSQESFGLWAGTAVNDTSSVVAAATVFGAVAASYAVVVKLARTLMIVPLVIFQRWWGKRQYPELMPESGPWWKLVPPFLMLFLVAAGLRSLGVIPTSWAPGLAFLAHFGITVAMAGVGMSSSIAAVRKAGWKPLVLGGILWAVVAISSLVIQWATGRL